MALFFVRLAYAEQATNFMDHLATEYSFEQVVLDEAFLDHKSCRDCPEHLELASQMIEILKQIQSPDNSLRPLEQARLDFLFYTVKHENRQQPCQRIASIENFHTRFAPNELSIVSDQILDIPNLSEVVIAPYQDKQVVYTFRGTGAQRDYLMEMIVDPNGEARLRTYRYKSTRQQQLEKLPELISSFESSNSSADKPLRFENDLFVVGVQTKSESLKSDESSLLANASRTNLSREIEDLHKKDSPSDGATQVSIGEHQGRQWMILSAQSSEDLSSHELVTAAPMSIVLDQKSNLRINTTLKNELQLARTQETMALDHAQGATLDLSNDQHRFVGVEVYQRESDRYNRLAVFNNFEVSPGSSVGSRFESDNQGNQVLSLTNTTQFGENSRLQIEGGEKNSEVFMTVRSEHRLTQNSSFSIGAANSESRKNEFVLQFKAKF